MAQRTKDIGNIDGSLLIFGGVYSNLEALQWILNKGRGSGIPPERTICTGDVVGYCSEPEACIQLIRDQGIHCIAGNVEVAIRNGEQDCGCNFNQGSRCDDLSAIWYPYAFNAVSQGFVEWMKGLPLHLRFRMNGKDGVVVHGSFHTVNEFIFKSTPWEVKERTFQDAEVDVVLGGHCGIPFSQEKEGKLWFNPGVIGMPANDGSPRCWYGILQPLDNAISYSLNAFEYDHRSAQRKMQEFGLPKAYVKTLGDGIWDNCEILPEKETSEQGMRLTEVQGVLK